MDEIFDVRFLEMGKYDVSRPQKTGDGYNFSDCYFDWVKLTKIDVIANQLTAKQIFRYDFLHTIRNKTKNSQGANNTMHLQETMVLVSPENTDFLYAPSHMYVSMINIPMWSESVIQSGDNYAQLRTKVFEQINQIIEDYPCRIYYAFDHCDYVLIADGTQIAYTSYLSKLFEIRKIVFESGDTLLTAVQDITTIYGFNEDYISQGDFYENSAMLELDLIVRISFKDLNDKSEILKKFAKEDIPNCYLCTDVIGRYDSMFVWKGIHQSVINKIKLVLVENNDKFFCYSVNLGSNAIEEKSCKKCNIKYDDNRSNLCESAKLKFDNAIVEIEKSIIKGTLLVNAIQEIYRSIIAMLQKDFSQYYTLSFYESFFSFVDFVLRISTKKMIKNEYEEKENLEKIYEIYRAYFWFLNALTACTVHSERQFLQTDAYQLLYFDAPPKLIAFYTALANKITQFYQIANNKYTFLITPDFKKDIFVESLTNDRTFQNEHNILVIHIDEESLYDVKSTIAIITHEIFHHIGQSFQLRKLRAARITKCCLAYVIAENINMKMLKEHNMSYDKLYEFYASIVEELYRRIFEKEMTRIVSEKSDEVSDDASEIYYFDSVIRRFISRMVEYFRPERDVYDNQIKNVFRKLFDKPISEDLEAFGLDECQLLECKDNCQNYGVLKKFSGNQIARDIYWNIYVWLLNNNDVDSYSEIKRLFRESFADYNMLSFLAKTEDKDSLYSEMLHQTGAYEMEDEKPRIIAVMEAYGDKKSPNLYVEQFNTKKTSNNFDNMYEIFYCYLEEEVSAYLREDVSRNFPFKEKDTEENDSREKVEYEAIQKQLISCLEVLERGSPKDIVEMMDKEIFEYRQRLLKG